MASSIGSGAAMVSFGGGPSRVVNKTYISAVLALKENGAKRIISPRFGLKGILDSDSPLVYDLMSQPESLLTQIANQAGAAAGTARRKLDAAKGEPERLLEILKKNDVHYYYPIGGDDTASQCLSLQEAATAANYELVTIHMAKTIDNDLNGHHHTPGYGSAALYTIHAVHGIEADNRSIGGVQIVVCMGMTAGFLSAAPVFVQTSAGSADAGPHAFFLPEQAYSSPQEFADFFTGKVAGIYDQFGRALVVVSEGVGVTYKDVGGKMKKMPLLKYILDMKGDKAVDNHFGSISLSRGTALGDFLVNMVKSKISTDVRSTTLGYPQRSFPSLVSAPDAADAALVGEWAVNYTLNGESAGSVALNSPELRNSSHPVSLIPLSVAGIGKREMPQVFLSGQGCLINTGAFLDYLLPLVGNELPPPIRVLEPRYAEFKV